MTIPVLIVTVFLIIWEMFHERISSNLVLPLLLNNFVSGFRLELMYIYLMVDIRSCLIHLHGYHNSWNHFFSSYLQNKSSESKLKFWQVSNHCKSVLESTKLSYANKTKESINSQKSRSWDFWWRIANGVFNKGKSTIPPLFNNLRCCLLYLIKQNC